MDAQAAPIVSVIIATYNWSSVLRLAIESVLRQTLRDFELLVVGDACTDDSAEVVASFGDPRIRWHNLPENCGNQYGPNNAGIEMARGRFIAYLGHDDLWLPNHLERHVATMEKTNADVTYSWLELIGPEPVVRRCVTGIDTGDEYEGKAILPPSAIMHRREVVQEVGPWKDYRTVVMGTDVEFIGRLFQSGRKFAAVRRLTVLKFPAAWRPGCYIEKPVREQVDALQRIRENPDFLRDELHLIVESLLRRHPDELTQIPVLPPDTKPGVIIEHALRVRGVRPEVQEPATAPESYPPLCKMLDLTKQEAAPYLWTGWSWPEPVYRWTDKKKAGIIFHTVDRDPLLVRMHIAPFLIPGKLEAQPVTVIFNGQEVAQMLLTNNELETHQFLIDSQHLQADNMLEFHLPKADMPMNYGYNMDTRELGMQVSWIEFAPQPPAVAAGE